MIEHRLNHAEYQSLLSLIKESKIELLKALDDKADLLNEIHLLGAMAGAPDAKKDFRLIVQKVNSILERHCHKPDRTPPCPDCENHYPECDC